MDNLEGLREIARRLRQLQRASPTSKDGLDAWYSDARGFAKWLESQPAAVDLPEQVWHYLHDADIRVKDPERAAEQNEMLTGIIASLEQGTVPDSVGVTVSIHPRWLGVFALILVAIIAYCVVL
ncbi:hypothetical protein [Pseudoxanthomonas wuyuanensis]